MTEVNTPNDQTGEQVEPQLSAVDLVRVALHAAREAAKARRAARTQGSATCRVA
ncbi:hypothetical protein ABT010_33680 [Streptomyces sp. NPDC002668]|uniref:hypothetical protein n=1 Tax=Streptomyces sp. NPDC002668 TaxID=3154422 RepID=UPI003317342B